MKTNLIFFSIASSFLLASCGPSPEAKATQTAVAAAATQDALSQAATATHLASAPKTGRWEGTAKEGTLGFSISRLTFTVNDAMEIVDFTATVKAFNSKCTEGYKRIPIADDFSFQSEKTVTDNPDFFIQAIGRFDDPSTASGTLIGFCSIFKVNDDGSMEPAEIPWEGKWIGA